MKILIFLFAALAGFTLLTPTTLRGIRDWVSATGRFGEWPARVVGGIAVFGLLSITVIYAFDNYPALSAVHDISDLHVLLVVLGFAFGAILCHFVAWERAVVPREGNGHPGGADNDHDGNNQGRKGFHPRLWHWLLGILGATAVATGFLTTISLPTPFGEAELSADSFEKLPKGEQDSILELKTAKQKVASLRAVPDVIKRVQQNEIRYREDQYLNADLDVKERESYRTAQKFLNRFILPIAECAKEVEEHGHDAETVRSIVRPVTLALWRLLEGNEGKESLAVYAQFLRVTRIALERERALLERSVECESELEKMEAIEWVAPSLRSEIVESPFVFSTLIRFWRYTGNSKRALIKARKYTGRFKEDPNLKVLLAELVYFIEYPRDNDMKKVLSIEQEIIDLYTDRIKKLNREISICEKSGEGRVAPMFQGIAKIFQGIANLLPQQDDTEENGEQGEGESAKQCGKERIEWLAERAKAYREYRRFRQNIFASRAAEAGLRPVESLKIATRNYDESEEDRRYYQYIDTLGFVKMSIAARKETVDYEEIVEAKALFDEALERAYDLPGDDRARAAAIEEFTKHYVQAQKLLGEYRGYPPVARAPKEGAMEEQSGVEGEGRR